MKSRLKFIGWRDRGFPPALFDALASLHPEGHLPEFQQFECNLPYDDPRVGRLLACLTDHGQRPWRGLTPPTVGEVSIRIDREYTRKDLEAAPAVQLNPISTYFRLDPHGPTGRLVVPTSELNPKSRLIGGGYYQLLASDDLKQTLESSDLTGLVFRPIDLEGPARSVSKLTGRFWELDTDTILPPLHPAICFYHASTGDQVPGNSPPPFIYREGPDFPDINFSPPELRYASDTWSPLPPFDLARTLERPIGHYGIPLASPRLYRLLASLRIPSAWVPVRVTP